MENRKNTWEDEKLEIWKKMMENSYQRKELKQVIERVSFKLREVQSSKFPESEFEKLKNEFSEITRTMSFLR